MNSLNTDILNAVIKKTSNTEGTVRVGISNLRNEFPHITINAAAYLYAKKRGHNITGMLDIADRKSLKGIEEKPIEVPVRKNPVKKKKPHISYSTDNYFLQEHVAEFNRAFHSKCYTSANIIARKIMESLVLDILQNIYPLDSEDMLIYFDPSKGRFRNFSELLVALQKSIPKWPVQKQKAIARLVKLCKEFKDDANDKTHSLFYIVKYKKEINELDIPTMLKLVETILDS